MKKTETINKENSLTLSQKEWQALQKALNTPQKPTKALKELMSLEDFEK